MAAKTTAAAVETGATTAVEGVKTVGKTVAGYVDGGSERAGEAWREGAAQTRSRARSGGQQVQREANTPGCPPR